MLTKSCEHKIKKNIKNLIWFNDQYDLNIHKMYQCLRNLLIKEKIYIMIKLSLSFQLQLYYLKKPQIIIGLNIQWEQTCHLSLKKKSPKALSPSTLWIDLTARFPIAQ